MNKRIYFLFTSFILLLNSTLLFADQVNTMQVEGRMTTDTLNVDTVSSNNANKKIVVLDTLLLAGLKSAKATDSIVTADPITGELRRRNISQLRGGNMYTADGTLTGNRTVTMSNNNINFIGGNIGIGNANPLGPLHFDNAVSNRKAILYQRGNNNDHEFYGFGTNPNILRYQVDGSWGLHVFYSGMFSWAPSIATSKELMRITGDGNIGIDYANPLGPLHFAATQANRKIILYQIINNDNQFYGFGINSRVLRYQIEGSTASHVFYAGINAMSSKEIMRIQGDGKVLLPSLLSTNSLASAKVTDSMVMVNPATGELRRRDVSNIGSHIYNTDGTLIGNRTVTMAGRSLNFTGGNIGIDNPNPWGPLHFENIFVNRKIILYQTINNDHQFYGLGVNSGVLRYQVEGPTNAHVFYSGIDANSSKELMRIQGDGKILVSSLISTNTIASANVTDSIVTVNPATGELRRRDVSKIGSNVYNTDGTLTSNRTVTMANNNINFIGGNIGIGNANPFGLLHFDNTAVNRKIILYQTVNNEHQFYGFGIGSGTLRYQVEGPTASHIFYSGIDANSSTEIMRIQGDGKILIPSLTSANTTDSIVTVNPATGELRRKNITQLSSANIYNTDGTLTSNRTVDMAGNYLNFTGGKIGINNATPWGPLHFDNTAANRKIILYQDASTNDDHQFYGFGINTDPLLAGSTLFDQFRIFRYQVPSSTASHVFYAGIDATSSREIMRITGEGNVGIGISNPRVPLHIVGQGINGTAGTYSYGSRAYFVPPQTTLTQENTGSAPNDVSIYAIGTIVSGVGMFAVLNTSFSDKRIKKDITLSDGKLDLNILNKIRVTNYKLIDFIKQGNGTHKKVIAQELEQVYPQAVLISTSYIPNVYQPSTQITYLSDTLALISFNKVVDSECVAGRKIRFHDEKGVELFGFIKEVKEKSLMISRIPKNQENIFVYGVEIDDFKSVDYNAISMLNVSATQEIYKQVITQENAIQKLGTNIQKLEANTQKLETNIQQSELHSQKLTKQLEAGIKLLKK